MIKTVKISIIAALMGCASYAQDGFESAFDKGNSLSGNFGFTQVGEQTLIGFRLQPEFKFGKFGLGTDIPLLYDMTSKEVRMEEFTKGVGVLRLIRYFSYGTKKKDPVYVKLGDMTGEELGYGILVSNYTNATSFERRKVGLSADLLFKEKVGLEAIYSDLNFDGSMKMLAVRPYIKPLSQLKIPIIKTMEIGASYVTDQDAYQETGETVRTNYSRSGNQSFGADLGFTVLKNAMAKVTLNAQYASILKNDALAAATAVSNPTANYGTGTGYSAGVNAGFRFLANIFHMDARLERQWYGENFIPQLYNFAYEINKDARMQELVGATSSQGIYGKLGAEILAKVKIDGELVLPDDIKTSGRGAIVGLNLQTKELANIKAKGQYVKAGLNDLGDAFKFDERSIANILVTYRLNKFMEVGMDYQWTFAKTEDGNFKAQNQVRPYVGLSMNF